MKLIPDSAYRVAQCAASRISEGSGSILPLVSKLAGELLGRRMRLPTVAAVIIGAGVAAFQEPRLMLVFVPFWVAASWALGVCSHCAEAAQQEYDAFESAAQNDGDQ